MWAGARATGRPASPIFVLGIALWEGLVRGLDVQRFLLPPPSDILGTFWDDRDTLVSAGLFTFKEALGGFLIGSAARSSWRSCSPAGAAGERAHAVCDRRQRGADHRLRADHEQLVRDPLARLEDGDRGGHLLLPGDGEHAAGADVRPAGIRSS